MKRRLALGVLAVVVLTTGACGPGRSKESFCKTFEAEAVRLHDKYEAALAGADPEKDPFGSLLQGLGTALEAQGDLVVLFDRLERVAPEFIQPDVAALRDAFKKQAEAMQKAAGDPLGALGSGLVAGLQAQGAYNRVESYLKSNCDLSFMGR